MDLLLAQSADGAGLEIGKLVAQLGATGVLGFMWWVARQDLKEARDTITKRDDEITRLRDEQDKEQRKLITILSGGKSDESHH